MHLHEFGICLRRIHSLPLPTDRTTCAPIKHLAHHHRPSVLYDCIGTIEVVLNSWETIARQTSLEAMVICHGDARPRNAHFHPTGATLFDFEYSTIDTPLLDIGNVAWWLSGHKVDEAEKKDLWWAYIDGYAGPGQEWNLPDFATLPYFVLQAEHKSLMFLHNYISLSDNSLKTVEGRMQNLIR